MNKLLQLTATAALVAYIAPSTAMDKDVWRDDEVTAQTVLQDVNDIINGKGKTTLHGAAQQGHTDKVRALLKRGADVNAQAGERTHRPAWGGIRRPYGYGTGTAETRCQCERTGQRRTHRPAWGGIRRPYGYGTGTAETRRRCQCTGRLFGERQLHERRTHSITLGGV